MKLISFNSDNRQMVGVLEDDEITEIKSSMIEAIKDPSMKNFEILGRYNLNNVNINVPVSPSKIVCVGLNYIDHAKELGMEIPEEPIIFLKPSTAVIGHLDTIFFPKSSTQVDYEGELGIVIKKQSHHIKSEER